MIGGNTYGLSQRTVKWGKDYDSDYFKNVNKHIGRERHLGRCTPGLTGATLRW